ncbi:MAG: peptide/nickel transport system permease protein [Actinomycetota bacterium]|nr:peptide/nickel transport system permease protein [Actinomycetota bacterium]
MTSLQPQDAELELAVGAEAVARTQWQLFWRRFFRHRLALGSLIVLILLCIACFGANLFAPYSPTKIDISLVGAAHGPSWKHWFGTDELGRDQLSVLMYAGQISLRIGLAVAAFSTVLGVLVGAAAGYFGSLIDRLLSATTDLFLVVPQLALLAVALRHFGRSPTTIIVVLALLGWTYIARVVRGQVLSIKEKEFVEAARASGASSWRIIIRHILPNLVGAIMVNLTLSVAVAIIAESTLSFLGFGISPPKNSWGLMLSNNEGAINDTSKMHLLLFPGLALLVTVMCVNFLGDGLRDAFDPQAKH